MNNNISHNTALSELAFSIVDTETSGGRPETGNALVEIAAVKITPGFVLDLPEAFSSLINPEIPISPEVTAIHGITDKDVTAAPCLKSVLADFSGFVKNSIIVAHNAPFDCKMINASCRWVGLKSPVIYAIDTVKLSRKLNRNLESHNLDTLISYYGVETPRPGLWRHRALYDADLTAMIFCKMLAELDHLGLSTLGDLYDYAG